MKKNYFLIIAIVCVMGAKAQYSGGAGTSGDPYQISTAADLVTLSTDEANYDKEFIVTADIDMSSISYTFYSLGYYAGAGDVFFTGVFDGNNKTISNLTITPRVNQTYQMGFFGLAKDATVMDLGLVNLNYTSTINRAGGLIGSSEGTVSVSNCFIDGGNISAAGGMGGIVGWVKNGTVTIANCYTNLGVIINAVGTDKYKGTGGIIGVVEGGTANVTNVAVYGSKADGDTQGAVIGFVIATVNVTNAYYKQGSGAAYANTTEITDLSAQSSYTGFDFTSTWEIDANRSYATLQGFAGLPLAISDVNISNSKVICIGKTLYIDTEEVEQGIYTIYNLSGVLVAQGEFAGSDFTETLNIQKGIYIVKVGALATKIKVD
ncbi:T9SS type A sorting domain-containing protein [Labilibacter marinus]|uniref:T9SS type A sorting domain-containing protein n=1 Tax=Labilibacter marinus TaxID=1477105 RepID=UPI00082DF4CC|nr:T9SS type A sorting domain-containing protein [Labilibacter marinus]